jgi:hypothetical protein
MLTPPSQWTASAEWPCVVATDAVGAGRFASWPGTEEWMENWLTPRWSRRRGPAAGAPRLIANVMPLHVLRPFE